MSSGAGAGAADEDDSADNQDSGKQLLPGKMVKACPDADDGGDDRLEVGIHADKRRTKTLLAERNQEVGNERGEENQIADFPDNTGRDSRKVCLQRRIGSRVSTDLPADPKRHRDGLSAVTRGNWYAVKM